MKYGFVSGAMWSAGIIPLDIFGKNKKVKLTILHTNDMHSRVDPFPKDGSRNEGRGGLARRAALIKEIRAVEEHVLLFDSGDIMQGTPYFNFFGGEVEFKAMSKMGYDAATVGNHDFDAGIDGLDKQLKNAGFPLVCSNYDFSDTILEGKTKEYLVLERGGLKIGVLGLGIKLDGLVPKALYQETRYLDPVEQGNRVARILREEKKCDLVVCLSHLGYKYKGGEISDVLLAPQTRNIDIILGAHTHTFLDRPDVVNNLDGKGVLINQVGFAGIWLGRIDLTLSSGKKEWNFTSKNLEIRH